MHEIALCSKFCPQPHALGHLTLGLLARVVYGHVRGKADEPIAGAVAAPLSRFEPD